MNITISPRTFFQANLLLIALLFFAHIVGLTVRHYFGYEYAYGLVPMFDFGAEKNIPTLYSSIALLFASALLMSIASSFRKQNTSYLPWLGLSLIFLFLAIDETCSIHERFSDISKETFNTSGIFFFAWVIPYTIALIVMVAAYSHFLTCLPRSTMIGFVLSGATFVSGAVGFEMLGGLQADVNGKSNLLYSVLYTCEETLEMLGIATFIYTLLKYIVESFESLTVVVVDKLPESQV